MGLSTGTECSFRPMLLLLDSRDPGLMHETRTTPTRYPAAPSTSRVPRWAGARLVIPAAMGGGGVITLLFELSDGIGWALLVLGAWFLVPVIGSAVGPHGPVPSSTAPANDREARSAHVYRCT
jgi:hypothetical protein